MLKDQSAVLGNLTALFMFWFCSPFFAHQVFFIGNTTFDGLDVPPKEFDILPHERSVEQSAAVHLSDIPAHTPVF